MCSHASDPSGRHVDLAAIDRLAGEITELASHIHAATCRWLGLVAEFDRRQGWAQWGCKSCAHFVSWRCSIAPVAAREHVRVARRLEELPLIRAAFAHGRLSYSKVRALARVEGIAREEELLALAEHATAAQLERLIQAYRGVVATQRAAASGRPARYVTWDHADDGSLLLRARLPAEEGAIVLAALEAGVEGLGASAEAPGVVDTGVADSLPGRVHDDSAEAPAGWWTTPRKRLPVGCTTIPRKRGRGARRFRGSAGRGRGAPSRRARPDGGHAARVGAERARRRALPSGAPRGQGDAGGRR